MLGYSAFAQTPDSWTRVADFPDTARTGAVAFSIDSFGYVCLGVYFSGRYMYPTDLWQYDPYNGIWTQKASFPGIGRSSATCFVIGSKAYIGLGDEGDVAYNDFWEYDPSADTWIQKANFVGGVRTGATGFSIGDKGYIGLGTNGSAGPIIFKDFWAYDPTTNVWTQKNDFAGLPRDGASGFSIGSLGYVALGYDQAYPLNGLSLNDLWQYAPSTDSWTQKTNYPGKAIGGAVTFTIGTIAYLGTGNDSIYKCYSDFWKYDPQTDIWVQKDSFGGGLRSGAVAFSIGNRGYAGGGDTPTIVCLNDFWVYTPDSLPTGIRSIDVASISIYPDPATDRLYISGLPESATHTISDMTGRICSTPSSGREVDVSTLPSGVYLLRIQDSSGFVVKKFVKD